MKDILESGMMDVEYLRTDVMIVNFLTKPLQGATFKKFRDEILGNTEPTTCRSR